MIHRVTSSLSTFKSIHFRPGLNLVIAEKSEGATDRQTRNSSGKSSLIEIIHFLLGSDCKPSSIFKRDGLINEDFSMSLDLGDHKTTVTRSGSKPSQIIVDGVYSDWVKQPKTEKESGDDVLSNNAWKEVLGEEFFNITQSEESYEPSFRALISYFVRRENAGAFQDPRQNSTKQVNWDVQLHLSYLLGLDWKIAHDLQKVRLQEKSLKTLKSEAKSGLLGKLVGNAGEIRTRLTVSQRQTKKLASELEAFQVLPEYRDLEKEASQIAIGLSQIAGENTLDLERIEKIQEQLNQEDSPQFADLEKVYEEATIVLPELVKKQLSDVREFNEAVIRNRKLHLQDEIDRAIQRIQSRSQISEKNDARRIEILNTLSSHGALDQLNKLQEEYSRKTAEVEELQKKLEMTKQLESQETELTIERAQIRKRLSQDIEDRTDQLNEAIVTFEDFSEKISDHEGSLVIDPTENGPDFDIRVEGGESKGIRNMQIFCFDLTLAVIWARKGYGPGFLIHDSHLFDGMDSRQIAKAIEIGAEQAELHGFQYIVTLNSDVLASAEFSKNFDPSIYRNSVEISDATETGGIFGCRI